MVGRLLPWLRQVLIARSMVLVLLQKGWRLQLHSRLLRGVVH
jgi:hypothetical protein